MYVCVRYNLTALTFYLISSPLGYIDSIAGLKSGASPHASLTPSHSALKSQSSSSKIGGKGKGTSPASSSKSVLKKNSAAKNNTRGKASSSFLAGRAN